jgi:hypothetical protein
MEIANELSEVSRNVICDAFLGFVLDAYLDDEWLIAASSPGCLA